MNQKRQKKLAICYLAEDESRDFYITVGLLKGLQDFYDYDVEYSFSWNLLEVMWRKPDLIVLPNVRGNKLYFEIADYAVKNEIPLLHHDSEGNFNTEIEYGFWGYNKRKAPLSPIQLVWNYKVKNYLVKNGFLDESILKIAGAPGFDKYRYTAKKERSKLLKKYGKENFSKVVGYAGWTFGKLDTKEKDLFLANLGREGEEGTKWLENQLKEVRVCIKAMIEAFPDVLFIMKKHPRENYESDLRDSPNEMNVFLHYPNVLYLKNEEEVNSLIGIADLWTAFESTTIMEAWLSGVPTLMINPDPHFTRVNLYKGSPMVQDKDELVEFVSNFFSDRAYSEPESIVSIRQSILSESIGYGDGLNHLRALFFYDEVLKSPKPKSKYPLNLRYLRLYFLLHFGKLFYNKSLFSKNSKFKKTIWVFESYKLKNANTKKNKVFKELDSFYENESIPERMSSGILYSEFKKETI